MTGLTAAIDAGTSLIKVVLIDDAGTERVTVSQRTRVLSNTRGHSEQDMAEVLAAVVHGLAEAVQRAPEPIARIGITAQGDGFWPVRSDGEPAGPAILWNDARSADVVEAWQSTGALEAAFRINGSLGNSGLPHAILASLQRDDPDRVSGVASILTCGSWLYLALTGVMGLHPSEASAPWLDVTSGEVSETLLSLYDLAWARDLIPPVLDDEQLTAPLGDGIAAVTGLPAGVPVTLAPYDVVATGWGSGALEPGSAFCILGTTLCVGVQLESPDTAGPPSGLTLRNGNDRRSVRAFATLAGTGVVDWMMGVLQLEAAADLSALAASAPPGAHGLRVWPYLSEAGERAPFLDADARGVFAGITFSTSRADLARATIEGLAHVIRDCVDATGSRPETLALSGGGAASTFWCQTIADTTAVPVTSEPGAQLGARGAHIAALAAELHVEPVAIADTISAQRRMHEPVPAAVALAEDRHADFLASRSTLASRWRDWDREQ